MIGVGMSAQQLPKGASRGFTLLNLVVCLAMLGLFLAFAPIAFSELNAKAGARNIAMPAQGVATVCHSKESIKEEEKCSSPP